MIYETNIYGAWQEQHVNPPPEGNFELVIVLQGEGLIDIQSVDQELQCWCFPRPTCLSPTSSGGEYLLPVKGEAPQPQTDLHIPVLLSSWRCRLILPCLP